MRVNVPKAEPRFAGGLRALSVNDQIEWLTEIEGNGKFKFEQIEPRDSEIDSDRGRG